MARDGLFDFEGIDDGLPFVPLAGRRTLDALGLKLSLAGWLSLSTEDRWAVVRAGSGARVDVSAAATLERARPAASRIEPRAEALADRVPATVSSELGRHRPLDVTVWASLTPLQRYALVKSAGKPEKLARAYDEIVGPAAASEDTRPSLCPGGVEHPERPAHLTHLSPSGDARMVDVGEKKVTSRRAVASACLRASPSALEAVRTASLSKGDVVAVARVAGILAAKRTPELIPLCHPVHTTQSTIDFDLDVAAGELHIRATVEAVDRTGVEMEALVAATVAALTAYDMIKGTDRWARIDRVQLESKSGGKSGLVTRPSHADEP